VSLDPAAWRRLWQKFSLRDRADHWFAEIARRYDEPHRHYHNAQHINDCLAEFSAIKRDAPFPVGLELAIWLHDVIYDPHRSDNEDQSVQFAIRLLNDAQVDELFQQRTASLISDTKHNRQPTDKASELMIDIDLTILGQTPERFWEYEKQIRAEYAFVPEKTFREKRAEILERFLSRPRLYNTDHFYNQYESQARANLAASIQSLQQ